MKPNLIRQQTLSLGKAHGNLMLGEFARVSYRNNSKDVVLAMCEVKAVFL
jgi:hypothetical protein